MDKKTNEQKLLFPLGITQLFSFHHWVVCSYLKENWWDDKLFDKLLLMGFPKEEIRKILLDLFRCWILKRDEDEFWFDTERSNELNDFWIKVFEEMHNWERYENVFTHKFVHWEQKTEDFVDRILLDPNK